VIRFIPFLLSNLTRERVRTALTVACITVSFILFGVLEAVRTALSGGVEIAGQHRLLTMNKVSMNQQLPLSHLERIRALTDVSAATGESWFSGIYQDDRNQVTAMAVTQDTFFEVNPELVLGEPQRRAWLSERTGAMVGKALAYRFGWKVGDVVPLRSTAWVKSDGSSTWDLKIVGIFDYAVRGRDTSRVFFHWDYLNESLPPPRKDLVDWIVFNIADPARAAAIAARTDRQFMNSAAETRTTTEQAFATEFANQIGNVGTILVTVAFAVFFTMLLVTANTMGQSVRERTNELALMKAIGFPDRRVMLLVLFESVLITALGGVIGLAAAATLSAIMGPQLQQFIPFTGVPLSTYGRGAVLMIFLGVIAGTLPCIQAFRLQITEALRRG
jgi:putative ABC transport system permease protein